MSVAAIRINNQSGVRVVRIPTGPKGDTGASGDASPVIYFNYGDASPHILHTTGEDYLIKSITMIVFIPFNGVGAEVSIGTDADPDLLMSAADNYLADLGSFETLPSETLSSGTAIKAFIIPGAGASQGRCGILVEYAAA